MDQELVEYLDRRFGEIDHRFDELGRHFDVVAEQLMDKIQLVGEGVIGVDQKVDRLAVEMRTEFQNVDRRILHLQVRVIGRD